MLRRCVLCTLILLATTAVAAPRGVLIEDFEGAAPLLESYPGQDAEPEAWELTTFYAYEGQSLHLQGNTWKTLGIEAMAVADSTVWQVAVQGLNLGEMQAFGVSDGQNELFYTFFGRDMPTETSWYTVYQGAFPRWEWRVFLLPIGRDWGINYGYQPQIDQLIFVNDNDAGAGGAVVFDNIADVTGDRPRAPRARILYTVDSQEKVGDKTYRLGVQFHGEVFDPDSGSHTWAWDFGDSSTSDLQNPAHEFLVHADHPYTVGVNVTDPDGMAGGDTCQVAVATGPAEGPLTVNFVGDVFTGRRYEWGGGIIETQGVEALFEPTLDIFGRAADVNVANLEVSYTDRGTPHPTKSVVFRSRPENIVGIRYAGVDLVTLGNNHIIDYGEIGMLDTMDGLDNLGIRWFGAGSTDYLALLPNFWTEKGVRMGFLGLCNRTGRQWNYQPYLDAGFDKPGFAHLLPANLESSIGYTQPLCDVVIVQTHSGSEYLTAPDAARGARQVTPAHLEADAIGPDDPLFEFRVEPTPGERELRRLAIDHGADVLINHHPHVLQGFESYQGRLIAHSLGNFVFDLYYTETMPTLVLTLEVGKSGITGYRFTPAWINHYIPEPATGNLGREIIGRMAEYSRPMGALVTPISGSAEARIHLSRAGLDSTVIAAVEEVALVPAGGYAVSEPLLLAGQGSLSGLDALPAGWEARWGKELLWLGGFEDEGADLWEVNTDDEALVTDQAHRGERSLRLRRLSSAFDQTGTDLEKHLPCDPTRSHSAVAWLKAENAHQARVMVRFYPDRYAAVPLSDTDLAARFDGTCDWTRQWVDLETPPNAAYFDMRCGHEPPASGTGLSWYDDLALIEWEPWVAVHDGAAIPAPNNHRFLQLRHPDTGLTLQTVVYRETAYGPRPTSAVPDPVPAGPGPRLRCFPNPFNPRVTIEVDLRAVNAGLDPGGLAVEVFDLRGRKVRTLPLPHPEPGKINGLTWDGRNQDGQDVASGIYLVRSRLGRQEVSGKVTLVR